LSIGNNEIFVATHDGMAIRFHETDVRPMGRGAAGVKAISLKPGDTVIEMDVLPETPEGRARAEKKAQSGDESESEVIEPLETGADEEGESDEAIETPDDVYGTILTVTEKGFGKRTPIRSYRLTARGAQGVSNIRITDKNGKVAGVAHVYAGDQLLLITEQGMMIRVSVDDIRSMGRNTQGVRVINIEENDPVVAAVKVVEKEQPEGPDDEGNGENGSGENSPESGAENSADEAVH
jgi:DNA gyrase subunit A